MSLEPWGWEILTEDESETGSGLITLGKARKGGENRDLPLLVNERVLFRLQQLFDILLAQSGDPKAKRAIDQIAEHFRKRIARARNEQSREEIIRRHNFKEQQDQKREPN